MSETTLIICPRCCGEGTLWADGKSHEQSYRGEAAMCCTCNGSGLVTTAPDPRIAAAEEMAKALEATANELSGYVGCSDGCTCGDGWGHADPQTVASARAALAAWNALK